MFTLNDSLPQPAETEIVLDSKLPGTARAERSRVTIFFCRLPADWPDEYENVWIELQSPT